MPNNSISHKSLISNRTGCRCRGNIVSFISHVIAHADVSWMVILDVDMNTVAQCIKILYINSNSNNLMLHL